MKTLIVYYSLSGHTKKVAEKIAKALDASTEELKDKKNRTGFIGYMRSGFDAIKKKTTEIGTVKNDPSKFDMVIFGSPIWAGQITPALRTYLKRYKDKINKYSVFYCAGSPDNRNYDEFIKVIGKKPKTFFCINDRLLKTDKVDEKIKEFSLKVKKAS